MGPRRLRGRYVFVPAPAFIPVAAGCVGLLVKGKCKIVPVLN
jgi:hypothetical protein